MLAEHGGAKTTTAVIAASSTILEDLRLWIFSCQRKKHNVYLTDVNIKLLKLPKNCKQTQKQKKTFNKTLPRKSYNNTRKLRRGERIYGVHCIWSCAGKSTSNNNNNNSFFKDHHPSQKPPRSSSSSLKTKKLILIFSCERKKERKKEKASLKNINRKLQKISINRYQERAARRRKLHREEREIERAKRSEASLRGSGGGTQKGDLATIFKCNQSTKGWRESLF